MADPSSVAPPTAQVGIVGAVAVAAMAIGAYAIVHAPDQAAAIASLVGGVTTLLGGFYGAHVFATSRLLRPPPGSPLMAIKASPAASVPSAIQEPEGVPTLKRPAFADPAEPTSVPPEPQPPPAAAGE